MVRTGILVVLAFAAGCDSSDRAKVKEKAGEAVDKVDKAIDNLDVDEAKQHLSSAKDAIARGLDAAAECSWAARVADDVAKDAVKDPVRELKRLCSFDAPLGRATKAVVAAEKAKAEQPEAPSYTECSSDAWVTAGREIEATPHAGDPRWTDLKARWAKICPR